MKLKDIEKSTNKNLYLLFLSVLVGLTAGFFGQSLSVGTGKS